MLDLSYGEHYGDKRITASSTNAKSFFIYLAGAFLWFWPVLVSVNFRCHHIIYARIQIIIDQGDFVSIQYTVCVRARFILISHLQFFLVQFFRFRWNQQIARILAESNRNYWQLHTLTLTNIYNQRHTLTHTAKYRFNISIH